MLKLNNLKSPKGAHRNIKRIGRGEGSGWGQQASKGHKGQKARSGGGTALGFEGGQMHLYRRLPKKGFLNAPFKKNYALVNLAQLVDKFADGDEVNRSSLIEKGFLKGVNKRLPIKILAKEIEGKTFSVKLTFNGVEKFSASAKALIEKTGGTIVEAPKKAKK